MKGGNNFPLSLPQETEELLLVHLPKCCTSGVSIHCGLVQDELRWVVLAAIRGSSGESPASRKHRHQGIPLLTWVCSEWSWSSVGVKAKGVRGPPSTEILQQKSGAMGSGQSRTLHPKVGSKEGREEPVRSALSEDRTASWELKVMVFDFSLSISWGLFWGFPFSFFFFFVPTSAEGTRFCLGVCTYTCQPNPQQG